MRTDRLAKRFFHVGWLGLPWLWIVHILYWRGHVEENNEGIINPDDHFQDEVEGEEATQDQIREWTENWVQRMKFSASVSVLAWVAWIVTAQLLRDALPATWYMLNADDPILTGW